MAFFALPQTGVANEPATCEEVLSNDTFKDVLTRNDGRDFFVFTFALEGFQLVGLRCDKAVLDTYFLQGGWEIAGHKKRPADGPFGPVGPKDNRYFYDTSFGYTVCRDKPFWQFWARRCSNSIVFHTYEGVITHISAGGNK